MKHSWVIVGWCGSSAEETLKKNSYLTTSGNPGFLKPVGIAGDRAYRPWLITPGIEVWQEINKSVRNNGLGSSVGRSAALTLTDATSGESRRYTFVTRFYRPGILVVEVSLKQEIVGSVDEAFHHRDFRNHPLAYHVVDCLFGIVIGGDINSYKLGNSFSAKAAMQLEIDIKEEAFPRWVDDNKARIAGLLINNPNYEYAEDSLADRIIEKSKDLDIKFSKYTFSIVSKQGLVTCFPRYGNASLNDIHREFTRRMRFLEYAVALQLFTEKFQEIQRYNPEKAEFLLFLCLPFLTADYNIPKSVTGTNTWSVLFSEFNLESSLSRIDQHHIDSAVKNAKNYPRLGTEYYNSIDYDQRITSRGSLASRFLGSIWTREFLVVAAGVLGTIFAFIALFK